MTQQESCGAAGGAISLWINIIECPEVHGIISTRDNDHSQGLQVYCSYGNFR